MSARRAQKRRRISKTDKLFDFSIDLRDLPKDFFVGKLCKARRMRIGMVSDLTTQRKRTAQIHDFGFGKIVSHRKKCRLCLMLLQNIENLRRYGKARPVVKGQSDHLIRLYRLLRTVCRRFRLPRRCIRLRRSGGFRSLQIGSGSIRCLTGIVNLNRYKKNDENCNRHHGGQNADYYFT